MNTFMTTHRSHLWVRTAFLAVLVAALAAMSAWLLSSVVHLSEPSVVLTVMLTSFAASWIVTNHHAGRHHVTMHALHHRIR
jgi:hypothetical protein